MKRVLFVTTGWLDNEIIKFCYESGFDLSLLHLKRSERDKFIDFPGKQYFVNDLLGLYPSRRFDRSVNDILLSNTVHFWRRQVDFQIDQEEFQHLEKYYGALFGLVSENSYERVIYEGYNGALNKLLDCACFEVGVRAIFFSGSPFLPQPSKGTYSPHRYLLFDRFYQFDLEISESTNDDFEIKREFQRLSVDNSIYFELNMDWHKKSMTIVNLGKKLFYATVYLLQKKSRLSLYDKLIFNSRNSKALDAFNYFKLLVKNKLTKKLRYAELNLDEKCIIYFMHYQPEQTSHGQQNLKFYEIEHLLEIVRSMPFNYTLYIKDHFAMRNNRAINEFDLIRRFPNVKFVDPNIPSGYFYRFANVIFATYNGSIGLEAALRNRPVITFSRTYYSDFGNVKYWYDWSTKDFDSHLAVSMTEESLFKVFKQIYTHSYILN